MGKLRGIVAKILLYTLFGLLILSFAVWGIGDMFRGRTAAPVVAQVGEMQVTQEEFRRAFAADYHRMQQMLGGGFDLEDAQTLGLPQQVLADLVGRRLYDAEAQRLGIVVTEDQIRREILTLPAFQNERGEFDRFRYEQVLRMNQLTETQLVQRLSHDIGRERILSGLVAGLRAPEPLAEGLYRYRDETRLADFVILDRSRVEAPAEPAEEELRALYEDSLADFEAPELRDITWLYIDPAALAGDAVFEESELRAAYDRRRAEFEWPERREVAQILLQEEAEAWLAYERVTAGEDFDALAEELTGDAPIELGLVARSEMPGALAEAVFAAPEAGVTEPIESAFGWHLVRIGAIEPGGITPFEAVREQLAEDLASHEAIESAVALANRLDDLLAGGASLEEAGADLSLEPRRLEAAARGGYDRQGAPLQGLPDPERFLTTAFRTPVGEDSLLSETEAGGFFVLRVDGVMPPAPRPFEEVREQVLQQWLAQERDSLAYEWADALADRLREGEDLEAIAAAEGLQLQRSQPLGRTASQPSRALVELLFGAEVGEAVVAEGPRGPVLAVLQEVRPAEPAAAPERLAELRERTGASLQQDLEQLFRQALEQSYGVTVNQRRVDDALLDF